MRNFYYKFLLLLICFTFFFRGLAQDLQIKTEFEDIIIKKDTSFVKNISVLLKENNQAFVYPIVYDSELEKISNIQVFIKKGKRFKPLDKIKITEENLEFDFIASKKLKSIVIPPNTEAKIAYTLTCRELMYFSDLRFFSYDAIDTLKYQISVPNNFHFVHNTIYKDSLNYMVIDSVKLDSVTKWNIAVTPVKVHPDPLTFFGIYKNMKVPLMRTLIIPENYKNIEKNYLNDWYLHEVAASRGLDSSVIQKIDALTKGISDPMKIVDTLYSYVRNNFKYVAIEIGMGAFIPTHANEVFTNKQGDCKDLSNFLSEALNYKGIQSTIALAATYHHISDCDFPSLSSANHVICVAYINDKPILLDPTDPIHIPETPVQSIQSRSILIINEKGGEFYKVAEFSPQQNRIQYTLELEANSKTMIMQGDFKAVYNGISGNFLRYELRYLSDDNANTMTENHYESVFGNQAVSDIHINNQSNKLEVNGKISVNGKIIRDGDKRFLFLDFLPRFLETETRETLLEGMNLGASFQKEVQVLINLDEPFATFNPIEHNFSKEGVSLFVKIASSTDRIIECNYKFVFDYVFIDKENLDLVNEILKSFKKITNEPIIF
jgi:hypothetical protein